MQQKTINQIVAHRRRTTLIYATLICTSILTTIGILFWENPMPFGTEQWTLVAGMRAKTLIIIAIVAICQSFATITFQTATQNRIITPSIMGFEALYKLVQTTFVFMFGILGATLLDNPLIYLTQAALMVALAVALYTWLLSGKLGNLHIMLLIGIILGAGLGSLATFMQRLLEPSAFDVLTARLFGSISNAHTTNLAITIPIVLTTATIIYLRSHTLNLLALGRETATSLGINHRRHLTLSLLLVSVLMSMTTSLVGPMTFLGFLVATLTYVLMDTHDHRVLLPASALLGYTILSAAYFIKRHIFYAQGAVSIIIELIGGTLFLIVIMRKGRL